MHSFPQLVPYGWDDELFDHDLFVDGAVPARVVRVDRGAWLVATPTGLERCRPARPSLEPPTTGDWIVARPERGRGLVLDAVLPRRTVIRRRGAAKGDVEQVLAANVDTVFVVHGLDRTLRLPRLERALVMIWDTGAVPVVVVNKADLGDGAEVVGRITASLAGVEVFAVSAVTGDGLGELAPYLAPGATVALIGESGAGKLTLVNTLIGEDRQAVGRTRRADYKGRHTTTSRELVPLGNGAVLVDTPGLRTWGLWEDDGGLGRTFDDVEGLFATCRFRDCTHQAEPGCAVLVALESGELDRARWASYTKLRRGLELMARRAATRQRRSARDRGRTYTRTRKHRAEW